jgi:hypothetical protein
MQHLPMQMLSRYLFVIEMPLWGKLENI